MWAVAAQHKKYNDSLSGYNSLRDKNLRAYFRRPQIRQQLLRANIINKDNKIVDEISSTKSVQQTERRQKQQLYHLLEDLLRQSGEDGEHEDAIPGSPGDRKSRHLTGKSIFNFSSSSPSVPNQEELIRQIKMATSSGGGGKNGELRSEDSTILQRLDRMIRAIREHEAITSGSSPHLDQFHQQQNWRNNGGSRTLNEQLWSSKSYQDVSSSGGIHHRQRRSISRESRPKSSYGRSGSRTPQRQQNSTSTPDLLAVNGSSISSSSPVSSSQGRRPHSPNVMVLIPKSKSCANLADDSEADEEVEIESLDGDSLTDDGGSEDVVLRQGIRAQFPRLPKKAAPNFSTTTNPQTQTGKRWYGNGSTSTVHHYHLQQPKSKSKPNNSTRKSLAMLKNFGPTVAGTVRQKVRMTLRYNGGNNHRFSKRPRAVKIFQQLTIGGNSILIYDGEVVPGDVFSFDIRPLPTGSNHSNGSSAPSPFSVILFVNGIRDLRINTCCPHKHRPGTRLSPDFTLIDVVGGRPCFVCQNSSALSSFSESFDGGTRGGSKPAFLDQQDQNDLHDETWFAVKAAIESAEAALAATEKRIEGLLLNDDDGEKLKVPEDNSGENPPDNLQSPSDGGRNSLVDEKDQTVVDEKKEEVVVVEEVEEDAVEDDKESIQLVDEEEEDEDDTKTTGEELKQQQEALFITDKQAEDKQLPEEITADNNKVEKEEVAAGKVANEEEEAAIEKLIKEETVEGQNHEDHYHHQNNDDQNINTPAETTMIISNEKEETEVLAEEEEEEDSFTTTTSSSITTLIQLAYNLDDKKKREEVIEKKDIEDEGEGDITKETLPMEMQLLPENGLDSDSDDNDKIPPSLTKSTAEPPSSKTSF